ncbi:Ladybird homeobox corepressor 1 [Pteropus alecto]|uniref:Ladybird homeobox corepressor 1 n=1 Tax=Pteropus alecto TaxID=9402 RepID=L5K138_PTEAL|nr:Ladybird homeobox corepressor 1 [Pteropus alecto]
MLWLAIGPFHAMENQVLVIRIKIPNSGAVDWTVHSGPQLLFRDVLDVIGQVLPEATTTAFEYEDEDGDRITVRSDEEMKAMLSYYYSTVMEQQVNGQLIEPLQIFPRACKPPGERNIHGLKVNTRAGPSQHSSPAVSDSLSSSSLKKSSAELKKILANGQMNEQDIRYRDTLGHGNGGTVYKFTMHFKTFEKVEKQYVLQVEGSVLFVGVSLALIGPVSRGVEKICAQVILLDITLELQKQIMSELEILYKCDNYRSKRLTRKRGSLDVYRKIPEHVLGRIAVAVVKGLTYLWSLKILHRDVKPSNMLVNTRGQVKLCDFGVSTQPERISGEQYGIHSDVWSLGISFMEPLQLLQCIVDEDSPVLPVGEFSEPFVHFITQCMRKQPKERPAPEELMEPGVLRWEEHGLDLRSQRAHLGCRKLECTVSGESLRPLRAFVCLLALDVRSGGMEALTTQLGPGREGNSSPNSKQELQPYSGSSALKPNQVGETSLYGVPIVSLVIDGQERLCLAQISNTLLKNYSYNEIHNRRVALGITCVQCTPVQLEILRRAGAMPISSRRCGMITKREAERLCKSFLGEHKPPKLPENFAFDVVHECAWGSRGSFIPARYNSSRAKCIKCGYCSMYFSPNKFIFHSHRTPDAKYTQPDAANFNSWRRHLKLSDKSATDELSHAWEDVKAMFNGGTRKRTFSLQGGGGGGVNGGSGPPPHKSLRCGEDESTGPPGPPPPHPQRGLGLAAGAGGPAGPGGPGGGAGVRSYPVIPVPSKGFGLLQKLPPPLFPHPYGFPTAFGLCPKKDDPVLGAGEPKGGPGTGSGGGAGTGGGADEALPPPLAPLPPPPPPTRKGSYVSAFRPVVKDAESIAKLYGSTRDAYGSGPARGPGPGAGSSGGYVSPDFLSEGSSSYHSASPDVDTADEPEVDVESNRFPDDEGAPDEAEPSATGAPSAGCGLDGDQPAGPPSTTSSGVDGPTDSPEGGSPHLRRRPGLPSASRSAFGDLAADDVVRRPERSPPSGGYELREPCGPLGGPAPAKVYAPERDEHVKSAAAALGPAASYLCTPEAHEPDKEDNHSTADDLETRKSYPDQRSISQPSPANTDRGEDGLTLDVTGTQLVEKDIENLARDELQKLLLEQMELRKKLEREFQSLKDNFQDQMKRELAYREEMVQQLQIVRDTLCNELDQERKARYAIQQKLKALAGDEFIRTISTPVSPEKSPPGRLETGRYPESQVQPELPGGGDTAGLALER